MRIFILFLLAACSPMHYQHGVPNFYRVDDNVWRSGQISTLDGWKHVLNTTHAKHLHVIKLNFDHEGSDDIAKQLGIDVVYLPIEPQGDQNLWDDVKSIFKRPDWNSIAQAQALLSGADADDVWLVHCTHGQDRTGLVIGVYRVLHDKWSKQDAYSEMRKYHFHWELRGLMDTWDDWKP